jgi:voltage-gated potassium channel
VICVLVVASPVAIARRLARDPRITLQTVIGALCIYLLIGLLFSSVYSLIGIITREPFFAQQRVAPVDYLYFSYVTLTTVGYGDLTAVGNLGRMLAATEALIGQLYLVSVVALVVGNIGRSPARAPEGTELQMPEAPHPDRETPASP